MSDEEKNLDEESVDEIGSALEISIAEDLLEEEASDEDEIATDPLVVKIEEEEEESENEDDEEEGEDDEEDYDLLIESFEDKSEF